MALTKESILRVYHPKATTIENATLARAAESRGARSRRSPASPRTELEADGQDQKREQHQEQYECEEVLRGGSEAARGLERVESLVER